MKDEQKKKFIEAAKSLECDESGKKFQEAVGKIIPPKPDNKKSD